MFTAPKPTLASRLHQTFILFAILLLAGFASAYSGGTGEAGSPYQIADVNDLLQLRADVNNYEKYFILTADINLAGYNFNNAVIAADTNADIDGFQGTSFSGSFDGNYHYISNLNINVEGGYFGYCHIGLFGQTAPTESPGYYCSEIKNLILKNARIDIDSESICAGGLVGYNDSLNITNCNSTVSITGSYLAENIGGLVGFNHSGTINNCSSDGNISAISTSSFHDTVYIGGLIGANEEGSIIINSHSSCNITFNGESDIEGGYVTIGGLVAINGFSPSIETPNIINCYSTGTIIGNNSQKYCFADIGGLVGYNRNSISNCFSTSTINITFNLSYCHIGGLVGLNQLYIIISDCFSTGTVTGSLYGDCGLGGLVGGNLGTIRNCYSVGEVNPLGGSGYVGGLVGTQSQGNIINSYFLNTSGPNNSLGEPLTDAQMKQQASFVGWDFLGETINGTDDIWWIHEDVTYPKLSWFILDTPSQILYPTYDPDCNIPIYWSAAEGATSYELDRSNNGGSTWSNVYAGTATFKVEAVAPGLYRYRVRGINSGVPGDYLTGPNDCNAILSTCYKGGNTADPNYNQWLLVGRPDCWCAPPKGSGYQCDGDADGITSGAPFNYRVFTGDLNMLTNNWKKVASGLTSDPNVGPATKVGACADIDHKGSGAPFNYRVFTGDLNIFTNNYKKFNSSSVTATDRLPGDCPR